VARKAQAGQFVIVRVHDKGERIPLTITDYDRQRGTLTLVVQEVGKTTMLMGAMRVGDRLGTKRELAYVDSSITSSTVAHSCMMCICGLVMPPIHGMRS
jgi:hypothetical protein